MNQGSCNACMNIANRRGVSIGTHVQLVTGYTTAEVLAVNHINSRVYLLLAGDVYNSNLWAPLEGISPVNIQKPASPYSTLPPASEPVIWDTSRNTLTAADPNTTLPWRTLL